MNPPSSDKPDEEHARLLAAYQASPLARKQLVELLAILYDTVSVPRLLGCVTRLELLDDRGAAYASESLTRDLDALVSDGLVIQEIYDKSRYKSAPLFTETITRAAVARGSFEMLAAGLTIAAELEDEAYAAEPSKPRSYDFNAPLRSARLALYRQDYAGLCALFEDRDREYAGYYHKDLRARLFTNVIACPFDLDWAKNQPIPLRAEVLWPQVLAAQLGLDPAPELFQAFEDAIEDPGIAEWQYHPGFVGQYLLLRGRFDDAEAVLAGAKDWLSLCVLGWLNICLGRYDQAHTRYVASLRALRKVRSYSNVYFNIHAGLIYLPLLLRAGDDKSLKAVLRYASSHSYYNHGSVYRYFQQLAQSLLSVGAEYDIDLHVDSTTRDGVEQFLRALAIFWLNPDMVREKVADLTVIRDRAQAARARWLEVELTALIDRLAPAQGKGKPAAEPTLERVVPMVAMLSTEPVWQRSLDALIQLSSPQEEAPQAEKDTRLVWILCNILHAECTIRAMTQSRRQKGNAYTKGTAMTLARLYNEGQTLDYLTEQDRAICATIRSKDKRHYSRRKTSYQFDIRQALRAMVGHPLLFLDKTPITLRKSQPEVRVTRSEQGLLLSFSPPIERSQSYLLEKESPTTLVFYELEPRQERIADILGTGLRVPERGKNKALDAMEAVSDMVVVNADVDRGDDAQQTVDADSRSHIQLMPFAEGLKVAIRVRPFATFGPYFRPGLGGRNVVVKRVGERFSASRDLTREQAGLDEVLSACPTIANVEDSQGEWLLSEPEKCLSALLELQALTDQVVIEWPKGETLRVSEVGQRNLNMTIRRQGDWFQASGEIALSDDEVVDIRTILKALETEDGRFIALGDGRFVALTRSFRQRLQELAAVTEARGKALRVSPLAAPALDELAQRAGTLDTDDAYQSLLQRIGEAERLTVQLPGTLRADLRDYQSDGFRWLCRLAHWGAGACLADDMGLGKTVQTLAFLLTQAHQGPTLIVAPTSVCPNWVTEAERFAPTLRPIEFATSDRQAVIDALAPFDVVIASYGILQNASELLSAASWRTIVLDEAQAIKNAATKRAKAAMKLTGDFKMILTGTPIENHLGELWNLFRFINPGLLGSRKSFVRRFVTPIERHGDQRARSALKRLIRPFVLRRLKSQVLYELPPRTEIVRYVELSSKEQALYEGLRLRALEKLSEQEGPGHIRILAEIMRLRRACCHPSLAVPGSELAGSKLAVFGEVLDELTEGRHKALVFSQFVDHLSIIRAYLDQREVSYQYLDGSTPASERKKRVDAFQSGHGEVFLISLKAGGTGLNLTAADYVIHLDPWWNPAVEDQASDRAHRIGQDRPVTIYRLVTKYTIEEKIVALHTRKRDLAESLLADTDLTGKLTSDELMALIRSS